MFLNRTRKSHTMLVRHDLVMDFSEEPLFEGDREIPVKVGLPYPIVPPLTASEDCVKQLLEAKYDYNRHVTLRRKTFGWDRERTVFYKKDDEQYVYLPRRLLNLYNDTDPDVYFDCDYNYYYTGGVLEYVNICDVDYLICPTTHGIRTVRLSDDHCTDLAYDKTTIYGLNSLRSNEGSTLLCIREKEKVSLTQLTEDGNIKLKWSEKYHLPVMDAKIIEGELYSLGIILADRTFSVRDIEANVDIMIFKNDPVKNCDLFQHFKVIDSNTCLLIDRYQVKVIDWRTGNVVSYFLPDVINCNALCNLTIVDNTLLLGSRHYILKTDLRYMNDVTHYSHGLTSAPVYMSYIENKYPYLCVSSHQNDRVVFGRTSLYGVPFDVPNISSTLKACSLAEPSLLLKDSVKERAQYSLTGMKMLETCKETCIYTSNYLGEIFKQCVSEYEIDNSEGVKRFIAWAKAVPPPIPVLHATDVADMSEAFSTIQGDVIEENLVQYAAASKAKEFLADCSYRYSKKNITSNVAKDFLSIWEDDEDKVNYDEEIAVDDKVASWIQMQSFGDGAANFSFQSFIKDEEN